MLQKRKDRIISWGCILFIVALSVYGLLLAQSITQNTTAIPEDGNPSNYDYGFEYENEER